MKKGEVYRVNNTVWELEGENESLKVIVLACEGNSVIKTEIKDIVELLRVLLGILNRIDLEYSPALANAHSMLKYGLKEIELRWGGKLPPAHSK